jgi:hypothetical protein
MVGLNLRSDLKRASDADFAALLDASWQRHDAAKDAVPSFQRLTASYRGPIRHPLAYPFISLLRFGAGGALTLHIGLAFSHSIAGLFLPWERAVMQMHLALCDIADITDELKRRTLRKSARSRSL